MARGFDTTLIDGELRAALGKVPAVPLRSALFRRIAPLLMKLRPVPKVAGVTISTHKGAAALRLYQPRERRSDGALLWIHGGGYIIGTASLDDQFCAELARDLGIVIASAEYRLAPRHPFPAPLDDCHAAWRWLVGQAGALGLDTGRLAIGGLSAGGGLAAALVQKVCDGPGPHPAAQWLFAPMLDDRTALRVELDEVAHPMWDNGLNRFGWSAYLGVAPGAPALPAYASPARREDLAGLPPTWIGVGSIELFHDEDVAYARRLEAAGVAATLAVVAGAPHGFEAWGRDAAITRAHLRQAADWLATRIG
ncbi:alpha/beta hydrolase [Novosphingobium album (ex Liu et al. 2023)]|uniref:Alpha/beta hydrolase n=1 Tax=Novosphingobium album (ex Liu et al. 2023) TaxID=3031130 RepID=A0ABT5WUU0_9SPHN|nr:alpha/beta hydrolase [Novosphingobium album (ex Liu et al. 2023)]MDE8653644.1 alpha/beta hydrolase [Novosphingobium album (ex Liu et al. 2023)]